MPQQVWQQAIAYQAGIVFRTKSRQVSDVKILKAAGIDSRERFEIDTHIKGHAVEAGTAADSQTDAGQLDAVDVNSGCVATTGGGNVELGSEIDNALFERGYEVANAEPGPANVDERINHELAGTVIGNLAATINLHDRDVARCEQVFGCRI